MSNLQGMQKPCSKNTFTAFIRKKWDVYTHPIFTFLIHRPVLNHVILNDLTWPFVETDNTVIIHLKAYSNISRTPSMKLNTYLCFLTPSNSRDLKSGLCNLSHNPKDSMTSRLLIQFYITAAGSSLLYLAISVNDINSFSKSCV